MAKPTFTRLSSLVNGVTAINGVITEIETAFQNTLSRDGSSPNPLTATLDANSQRIINLPAPASPNEPVRNGDYQAQLLSTTLVVPLTTSLGGTGSTTVAGARTSLGLGTAATLDVGTTANKVLQLDGSAKIPAVDGSQLTNLPATSPSPSTGSGNWVRATSPSLTNVTLAAGTASLAPTVLTSGTNLTTATAGAEEYDGKVLYFTPLGTQRGVVPSQQFFRLNADLAGNTGTSAQNLLGVGTTLSASTVYAFEGLFFLSKSAGTTGHTISFGFGGTATANTINFHLLAYNTGAAPINGLPMTGIDYAYHNSLSAALISGTLSSAASTTVIRILGTISVNAGGTIIPQYTLSASPGGAYSTMAGSFMYLYPVGAAGANTSVGAWA